METQALLFFLSGVVALSLSLKFVNVMINSYVEQPMVHWFIGMVTGLVILWSYIYIIPTNHITITPWEQFTEEYLDEDFLYEEWEMERVDVI